MRLSGAGLGTEDNPANRVRWLDLMEQAADRCIETLDRMEHTPPEPVGDATNLQPGPAEEVHLNRLGPVAPVRELSHSSSGLRC